jgi:hypothetical protein
MNEIELTPYSVWSANPDNKYNDPVESWSNYFENQREEFTAVGKYDEEVEQGIQSTLASVLVGKGILNQDNAEEIQKKLVGIQNKNSLGDDLKFLSTHFDPDAMEMSEERFADINDFNNAVYENQIPEGFSVDDLDDITKEVKQARKNFVTNLYGTGQIDAGVYFDEEGNRIFVGGRLKDGDTFENIVANSKKYGVKASDFLALKKLQEPAGGVYGDIPKHELAEGNAALQEINAIINEGDGRDFLDLRGKMTGLALAKRKKDEYGFWANTVYSGQDLLGDALRNARIGFNFLTFDEDEEELLRAQKLFESQQDLALEKNEVVKKQVLDQLSKITQRSGPVFEQAVESYIEKINADGIQDSAFGYDGREFDEDDLASNIRRTKYYGVLVHNALNVKPVEFRTALSEFGLSDRDIEVEDVKRVANLESNFSSTDEVLAETMGDDWQSAKAEGKQQGLNNHEILENFIRDNDVSVKWRGFGMSAWHSVTGLFYGAGALLDTDWGRDGIVENAKQINLNRELANIYGVEMGFGQDLSEALAPMVADMVVTAGAVGLAGVTFGGSLAVSGGYFAAKSAGGAAARGILGRAVVARTLIGNTMKNTLTGGLGKYSLSQRVYRNAATGELKEETLQVVATRIKKAGVLKGLKQGELIEAIKSYNSQLAKHVGVKAVGTFIPAAVRSGGATYGSVFSSLEKELTSKYFKDGAWADDWNEDRVKQEAHSIAYGTALMGGTVTGLITASFGQMFGGKLGGVESAFLKGMSFKQLKTVTDRLSGSVSSVEGLKSLMAQSITKTFKKYGSSKGLAFAGAVVGEGTEEAVDTIINQMVEDAWQNKESSLSETLGQALHAFKLGAVLGGTATVGGALVRKVPVLGNAVTDRRGLASLESSVMADFDERVAEATKANPELAQQRAQLKTLAPQTAEAAQKVLKKLNAEAKQKAEAKKQGETPAPEPSESEAPAVDPEEGPQPEFVISLAGYAKNKKPQLSSDLTDRANIILNAAIDKERAAGTWDTKSAAEVNKYIEEESIISVEQAKKDVEREVSKLKEKISANPDTDKTFENQESPEEKLKGMIGNSRWTSESRRAVNEQGGVDPETGDAEANSAPVGQHQYKTPEQKYNNAMLSLKLARGKWEQAVEQAEQLPKDSEARQKAEQAIEDGLNSGELIDPRRYDALSKAARSLKVEDDIADEDITEHDEAQLEDLVNGGFPVSIIQEHLQALGLTLDKTGDDNFRALSKRLSNLIEEKYPVFKKNVTSKDKLPDLFSADQKYVYLDEEGNGIFNNDPQQMMTFLKSHILIPVSEEVYEASTMAGSEVNPSFVIEKQEGSNQAYVVDILVPVRGGLVSAWADFRNIRKNNFNYSRVKGLLQNVEQLQETTPEDRLDIKVKNPFPSVEGTGSDPNITLRELLALAEDFKTLKQFIEAGDPPTGPDKKRIMVGSAQSRSRYYTAAAMSLGLSIKKKVYETAQQNPSNDNATQAPFNMAKLRDFSLGYFQDMARSRKEQQVLNLGDLVKQGERIDKNPNFDADKNASAGSGVAETPTPLPVLPKTGTGRYLRSNLATIATALEKDQDLRGDLISFLELEQVLGEDSSVKNKSASALVDLLLQHLVKGNNVASDSTLGFLTYVNKISETNPEAYNMIVALQAIGLSSPSLHPEVSTDADLLAYIKEEMVKAYGDVAQDISDSSTDEFFQLVSHHITTFRQNSIATEETDAVIEATNLQEIEDLGLVDGDVESVLEAIRLIKENGKPEFLRPLAKVILDNPEFVKTIVFKIESSDQGFSGEYDAETGQPIITINPRGATGESGIAGTLLHEYAHAFSVDFVAMPVELRTPEHNTRFAELEAHRAEARVKAEELKDEVFLNGTANVEEFIAYTLTSQEFRGFLGPSLLEKILRVVAKIVTFGRAKLPPTALQKSIANAMSSVRVGGALTQAGITNHVATRLFQTQTERAKIADAYGGKSSILAEARLEAKAEQFTEWVRDYLPPEIVMSTDETSSVVVKIDGETGVLVFNPKRAAVKLAQLVSDNEIDPDRQTHLLGALLNEEMGHAAANQILTDEQVLAVIQSMDDTDFIRIIKEYYPESEQAEAIARMLSEDAEVSSVEKYRLANEAFAAHASMAMRGMTTNEQIAFLQTNPSLLASFIQYLKAFLSKLTYHRTRKDLSPEMRDAVNNVVRELRAMELAYRPAPRSVTYNTRNGEQIVDALVKQAVGYRMLAPDDSSDDDATLDLESRFGADVRLAPVHKGQDLIDDAMLHGTKNIDAGPKGSRPHMIGMKFFEMMDPKDRIHWDPKNQDKIDRMGGRLYGVLQRALNEYPDFVSWYEERVQMSVDIFEELDPDIKKPEDNFVFKTLLAVTSNGNKVAAQTEDSWAIYQNWKKTGKFAPAETKNPDTGNNWVRGTRTSAITNQLKLMDGLVSKYTWEQMQKFLARSGTVKELKEALVSELDFTKQDASDLLKGELIDETVPFALIFGPKLGSFYHNLNGKFNSITMDLWFMRTFGRTAGTQMKVATPAQQRKTNKRFDDAVAAYLTKDPKGELFKLAKLGRKRKRSVEVVMALKNYYTSPANRSKYYDEKTKSWVTLKKGEKMEKISPLDNELRKATNQLEKIVDGHELVEAPQNGSHRRFMRLSMYNAMDKLEQNNGIKMIPAEAQAILWYYEKAVHTEFGSGKDEEAPDYATAANDVYRSITGSNAGSFTVSTANIRRRDLRGSVGEDSRSSRERRRNLDLESRFGADAKIPDFLNEVDMQEVEIGQWLELLDVPLMELHEYDIKAKDGTFGTKFKRFWIRTFQRRADKRVVRFFNQTNAFIRETKSIVEIYQKKHDRLLAQEEERLGQPIPPSLIAHASGSTNGSQLTFAQEEEVDSDHASDLAKAMKIMDQADRKAAIDAAAKAKASKIMLFRNKNRAAELNVRNNALKNLLTVSPKMYALIVEMRQLQDQLSKKGVDVFGGSMDAADLNLAFNFDRGIYITRRYRMFEDNDFAAKVLEDDVYEETRDKAVLYFAKQKALQDVDTLMQKHGVGYNEARGMVEDDLVNNPEHHASVGRKMMRSFIKGYQHGEARRQLRIKQGSSTQDIVLQDSFNDKALNKIAQTINEKKNIPDPVRELLGEFGEEAGSTNLGHSILHTASMLANQSFFNKIKKLGLESADPWLVTKEQYDKDPEKYEDWSQLKADTGEEDLAPIKGMYFKGDIAEQFEDLFNDPKEMRDINNERVAFETRIGSIIRKATGYSLALKTLGSVGFYFRNMVGNAMYFGPMQGYWGGGKLLFDEAGGGLAAMGSVMGEADINSNQSLMVQAARGSLADLNWHLTELKTMDVFGDELEVTQIQNLLAGRSTYADLEADLKKAGELHQQMANQINTKSKGSIPEGAADLLAKYGLGGWELTKTGANRAKGASDALMKLGGRLASAADGFFKIGLYNFELDTLVEAAKQAPPSDPLSKMISGPNNTPSSGLKQMAAEIVKDTTQSYSRALPIIKTFTRSSMGVVIAPYIRFAADVPRVFINGIFQAKKEMASKNPVIRKRGKRRALGALTTTAASLALTKGSQLLLFGFDDEDEMDMIRGGMPKWMRSSGICFYKTEDGEIYSTDLTFLNPFAAYQEPFVRGLEALLKGDIGGAVSKTLWVDGLLKPFASEQILAGAITDVVFNEDEYGRKLVQEGEDWGAFTLLEQVWKRAYEPRTFRAAKDSFDAIFSDKSEAWFTSPLGLIWKEVLPVKPHKLDVDKTFRRYLRNHMEDYRNNRMSLEKETMSPSDVVDEYNKFAKVRIYQANDFSRAVIGAEKLGKSLFSIEKDAKSFGVSKERLRLNRLDLIMRPVMSDPMKRRMITDSKLQLRYSDYLNARDKYDLYIPTGD